MKLLFCTLVLVSTSMVYANFGGYKRGDLAGVGQHYFFDESNKIELSKERLTLNIDNKLHFIGKFQFRNTSSEKHTVTLAFPQETFWEVPYDKKTSTYKPGKIREIRPVITINGEQSKFETGMTWAIQDVQKISFLNPKEMEPELVSYANSHEAQSPPAKAIVLWFHKDLEFKPNQEINVEISFNIGWSYQDEDWSTGIKKGERYFRYVTKTGGAWKDGKIKDFSFIVNLGKNNKKKLIFEPKDSWKEVSPSQFEMVLKDYSPTVDLKITKLQ